MAEFELPEKPEDKKERVVGLIIAAIAVVLAIVSAVGHETHNDEILAHVDAADQYAFFQAKKERHEQLELSADSLALDRDRLSPASQARGDQLSSAYTAEMKKLTADSAGIKDKGDELLRESEYLARKANVLDLAEIALQISVVLCSISILTEQSLFVRMGVSIAAVGVLIALWGVLVLR